MPPSFSPRLYFQTAALFLASTTCLTSQQPPAEKPANPTKAAIEKHRPTPDEPASASSQTLLQLNNALEALAAKVAPAVVQILVTSYGPIHEENRTQTALIVRQHA